MRKTAKAARSSDLPLPASTGASALVLLGGEILDPGAIRRVRRHCRGLICADGALRHALALGLEPDFVVGDMDSLPKRLPRFKRRVIFRCDFNEDRSDFEKALDLCSRLGLKRLYVAGVLGGRLDHALVNLALMERWASRFEMVLLDRQGAAILLGPGRYRPNLPRGKTFSLLAAPKAVASLSGALYPLENAELLAGSRGLSNRAQGPVRLDVKSGRLWFVVP